MAFLHFVKKTAGKLRAAEEAEKNISSAYLAISHFPAFSPLQLRDLNECIALKKKSETLYFPAFKFYCLLNRYEKEREKNKFELSSRPIQIWDLGVGAHTAHALPNKNQKWKNKIQCGEKKQKSRNHGVRNRRTPPKTKFCHSKYSSYNKILPFAPLPLKKIHNTRRNLPLEENYHTPPHNFPQKFSARDSKFEKKILLLFSTHHLFSDFSFETEFAHKEDGGGGGGEGGRKEEIGAGGAASH